MRLWWIALALAGAGGAYAQTPSEASPDSLRLYDLPEIEIVSGAGQEPAQPSTVQRVTLAQIARQDAASVADVARLVPSAYVQTNSRGETLIYLRNAGERQVAFFFDGALLNVPWDYRIDLSLVPASVIGQMRVVKGVPSVLYGTNVLGGAVNMTSRVSASSGLYVEAKASATTPGGARHTQAVVLGGHGRWRYTAAGGYAKRDGLPLPGNSRLAYNQLSKGLRTNTDRRFGTAFARLAWGGERVAVGASLLHINAAQGVAPEGHIPPQEARLWRYPLWRNTHAVVNGEGSFPGGFAVKGTAWIAAFAQEIERFASLAYETAEQRQRDDDRTVGLRLTGQRRLGGGHLRLALNALTSRHAQRDQTGGGARAGSRRTFRQHIYSAGAEVEQPLAGAIELRLGASVDGVAAPETADQPAFDPLVRLGVSGGAVYAVAERWTARAAAGRKIRFPTMRERFDDGLGRFVLNPALAPETAHIAEVGLAFRGGRLSGEAIPFFGRTFDTIDQRRVTVDGASLRQRVNLAGSRVYGVELVGGAEPTAGWRADGHLTWTHARGLTEGGAVFLTEKPAWLGAGSLIRRASWGGSAGLTVTYTSGAYGLSETNEFVGLGASLVLDARVGYRWVGLRGARVWSGEVFGHVHNLTDARVLPQLGLPGPGRSFRFGMEVAL